MTDEDESFPAGKRLAGQIREARTAAGLSQTQLAQRIGYSRNYVSMAERSGGTVPSRNIVDAIDREVGANGALGRLHDEVRQEQRRLRQGDRPVLAANDDDNVVREQMPRLRRALGSCDVPDDGPIRSWSSLRDAVRDVTEMRVHARYSQMVTELPDLLIDLGRARAEAATESEIVEATRLLVLAHRAADGLAFKFGYADLSAWIIESMRHAVAEIDDPFLAASVAYVRTETFFATDNLPAAQRALEGAVDLMPGRNKDTVESHAARGALHMRAAVVAARAGKVDDAADHLADARRAGERTPESVYLGTAFGPASVRIHEIAVALELGDSPAAVNRSAGWQPPRELPAERRSHYFIDLAPAQLDIGKLDDSFVSLQKAKAIAPQHVKENPRVRRTLTSLLRARRTVDDELDTFARWVGVR